jgi:hypothetical protein
MVLCLAGDEIDTKIQKHNLAIEVGGTRHAFTGTSITEVDAVK